jgi:hypothetical protein
MSEQHDGHNTRRNFLKIAAGAAVAAAAFSKVAEAADAPHIPENDPMAVGLGYKEDASKVDAAKFAMYKKGQTCGNCKFFQGPAKGGYAPCQIFSGKGVNEKGWCSAYSAKA